jgi:hypothetical protein
MTVFAMKATGWFFVGTTLSSFWQWFVITGWFGKASSFFDGCVMRTHSFQYGDFQALEQI